ncbi:MAG: hypothetical protein GC151_13490 [Betaproteobacteria bacterium]|nr:hypothetical protein [Betaproteobacteria bacterium]
MHDGIVHARTLLTSASEAAQRVTLAVRRWEESTDHARSAWDDAAGRDVFNRHLEPQRSALQTALPAFGSAVEGLTYAIDRASLAEDAVSAAASDISLAAASIGRARNDASHARAEVATARSEASSATAIAQSVTGRINALGG